MTTERAELASSSASARQAYTPEQCRVLFDLADLLLLQQKASSKLRLKANTPLFWKHAGFNQRVEELITDQAQRCERQNLYREFALLVAGWPQSQENRLEWTSELLVESAARALAGIAEGRRDR